MKNTAKILTVFTALLFSAVMSAQSLTINGTVSDETNGEPLIGASVLLKGGTLGTMTDIGGNFSIDVPTAKSVLVFSYIGYQNKEVTCEHNPLNVALKPDNIQIEDIVVVGYGTQQKRDLTGAIQSIKTENLVKGLNTNITESLNGHIAGVEVTKSSNRPGASMSMLIRGKNSINSSNEPLYVIDGVPSYSGMDYLNAQDIESIDVLKDASSCAIYGSQGANGVVIVTTKGAGKKEGFSIEYNGSMGLKTPTRIPDMIGSKGNGMDYVDYRLALWRKVYGEASLSRSDFLTDAEKKRIKNGQYYDFLRELSHNATVFNHHLNASGKSANTAYSFGLGYTDEDGMIDGESYMRFTANAGLEHKVSDYIKTGFQLYFAHADNYKGSNDALVNAYFIPPIESPWDEDGELLFIVQPTSSKINPLVQVENDISRSLSYYVNTSSFVEISPIKDLDIRSRFYYQYETNLDGHYVGTYTQAKGGVNPAEATRSEGRHSRYLWDNTATYKKTFADIHRIDLTALFSMEKEEHFGAGMTGIDLPYDSYWHAIQTAGEIIDVTSSYSAMSMISYMFRANYSLFDRYMITAAGRYDGTSRLFADKVTNNQWGFMPSVALAWRMNEEEFIKNLNVFDNLKLRLSYGKTGNNNLGYDITLSKLVLSRYSFGGQGVNGFGLSGQKGNPDLRWEMTSEYNAGLDFGFFNNRLSGSIDVYHRITDGLIFSRAVSAVNGFSSIMQNIGTTQNRGIELSINSINIKTENFEWRSALNFSLNRNKINDLYGDKKDDIGNNWYIGHPIDVIYNLEQAGIWQEEEAQDAAKYGQVPGQIKIVDQNDDGKIDSKDYVILGAQSPDWTAGLNTTFVYKNWDLYIDMYGRYGGLYNDDFVYMFTGWDNEHWNKLNVEYWTPENRSNKYPEVGAVSYHTQVLSQTSGSFLKIRNITLGYNLDQNRTLKKLGINNLRVSATAQNPFTFTNYIGADPEIIGENVYSQLSLYPMTFTLGLKVVF